MGKCHCLGIGNKVDALVCMYFDRIQPIAHSPPTTAQMEASFPMKHAFPPVFWLVFSPILIDSQCDGHAYQPQCLLQCPMQLSSQCEPFLDQRL